MNAPKATAPPVSRRILHINYPAALLRVVDRFCQSRKFTVDSFEAAPPGLHHALTRKYHLIILGLPVRGLGAARFLKGLLRAKISVPVLIMEDQNSKTKSDFGPYANVVGSISKPLDVQAFSKYLENVSKPEELGFQEMEKLVAVLIKWEKRMTLAD